MESLYHSLKTFFSSDKVSKQTHQMMVEDSPFNQLSPELLSVVCEYFTTQEGRLILSRVNKTFKEATRLCRLRIITPVFFSSVSLLQFFNLAKKEMLMYVLSKGNKIAKLVRHSYLNHDTFSEIREVFSNETRLAEVEHEIELERIQYSIELNQRRRFCCFPRKFYDVVEVPTISDLDKQCINEQFLLLDVIHQDLSSFRKKKIYESISDDMKRWIDEYITQSRDLNDQGKKFRSIGLSKLNRMLFQRVSFESRHYKVLIESSLAEEGISGGDDLLNEDLIHRLNQGIDRLDVTNEHSTKKIYVNPATSPYVENLSVFQPSKDLPSNPLGNFEQDIFGRRLRIPELKKHQFLPTYIDQDENGHWKFRNEIVNLPRNEENSQLYEDLEHLFMKCAPHLESAINYAQTVAFRPHDQGWNQLYQDEAWVRHNQAFTFPPRWKIEGKSLQVIVTISDYELKPGESHEGNFHYDGMPHEHIIATIDATLDVDDTFEGGGLSFKRGRLVWEEDVRKRKRVRDGSSSRSDLNVLDLHDESTDQDSILVPLGKVDRKKGRVIVFSNSHLHRVLLSKNSSTTKACKRRGLLIFVVDPNIRIISTQEVSLPQTQISSQMAESFGASIWKERDVQFRELVRIVNGGSFAYTIHPRMYACVVICR